MEFDKTKVYTALNADESLIGAKGYFANTISGLKKIVESKFGNKHFSVLNNTDELNGEDYPSFNFFYLVEPAPEKCGVEETIEGKFIISTLERCNVIPSKRVKFKGTEKECEQWIAEHSKPKYRPFKDCDELIKCYLDNCYKKQMSPNPNNFINEWIELPTIWVKGKDGKRQCQIKDFITDTISEYYAVSISDDEYSMDSLFYNFTFLDGSVCGVEEC